MDYEASIVSLSSLITKYIGHDGVFPDRFQRISQLMDMGTFLKEETKQADVVARLAVANIRTIRRLKGQAAPPKRGQAYIIRSFKLREEVELFRELYGDQFVLVSVYGSKTSRIEFLKRYIGPTLKAAGKRDSHELARLLINRDYEESGVKNGQQVGKTFPLADYFVNCESRSSLEHHIRRLVRLTFGYPYISPYKDEQGMFFAQAAALRSLDLSRQVGAAITSTEGEVLTTGCNDVPRAGGGLYWADDPDVMRDAELGYDANVILKRHIFEDTLARLGSKEWLKSRIAAKPLQELLDKALEGEDPFMKRSTFYDVIEFGRAVHAEMSAISQAARAGTPLQSARLFCTTFPCHICARHIVASGIKEVVFIEPYEKSRVSDLYPDSIVIEPTEEPKNKVPFRAFVGVAPRRYIDFFQSRGSKKNGDGKVLNSEQSGDYKKPGKKTFHIAMLEAFVVNESALNNSQAIDLQCDFG